VAEISLYYLYQLTAFGFRSSVTRLNQGGQNPYDAGAGGQATPKTAMFLDLATLASQRSHSPSKTVCQDKLVRWVVGLSCTVGMVKLLFFLGRLRVVSFGGGAGEGSP
jgi:hypothetical protein